MLDFSPVGGTTTPLLFSWEELGYTDEEENGYLTEVVTGMCDAHSPGNPSDDENRLIDQSLADGQRSGLDHKPTDQRPSSILFRVVQEENRVQPNFPQGGVPYDMVQEDVYEDLLAKLQRSALHQDQENQERT